MGKTVMARSWGRAGFYEVVGIVNGKYVLQGRILNVEGKVTRYVRLVRSPWRVKEIKQL